MEKNNECMHVFLCFCIYWLWMYEAAAAVIRHSFANCRVKHLGYVVWGFFLAFYSCNSFILYEKWKLQVSFFVVWVLLLVLKCIFLVKCVSISGVWLQKTLKIFYLGFELPFTNTTHIWFHPRGWVCFCKSSSSSLSFPCNFEHLNKATFASQAWTKPVILLH